MDINFTPRELEAVGDVNKALKELNNALRVAAAKSICFDFTINNYNEDRFDLIECTSSYIRRNISHHEWQEALKVKTSQKETPNENAD